MTRVVLAIVGSLFAPAVAAAQDPAAPRFEVASVRENTSVGQGGAMSGPFGSQFTTTNIPLRMIILSAYELRDVQLIGAPEWTRSARFDISAKYPEGTQSSDQRRLMIRQLLADRFGLVVRRETRELPVYRLVMAREDRRPGPSLVSSDVDCARWLADKKSQIIGQGPIGPAGARPACMMVAQRNYILAGTRTMSDLARALEGRVSRPVVDATDLAGTFDIDLQWIPDPGVDPSQGTEIVAPAASGSIFTALQEQLGLKLDASRALVEVLVIEAVSRPTSD